MYKMVAGLGLCLIAPTTGCGGEAPDASSDASNEETNAYHYVRHLASMRMFLFSAYVQVNDGEVEFESAVAADVPCPGGGTVTTTDFGRTDWFDCIQADGAVWNGGMVADDDGVVYDNYESVRPDGDRYTVTGGYVWEDNPTSGEPELIVALQTTYPDSDGDEDAIVTVTFRGAVTVVDDKLSGSIVMATEDPVYFDDLDNGIREHTCNFTGLPLAGYAQVSADQESEDLGLGSILAKACPPPVSLPPPSLDEIPITVCTWTNGGDDCLWFTEGCDLQGGARISLIGDSEWPVILQDEPGSYVSMNVIDTGGAARWLYALEADGPLPSAIIYGTYSLPGTTPHPSAEPEPSPLVLGRRYQINFFESRGAAPVALGMSFVLGAGYTTDRCAGELP